MENLKMNPEVKEKWLVALGSGEYKKGTLGLKKRTKKGTFHCCLGVLCELYIKEKGIGVWKGVGGNYDIFRTPGQVTSSFPPTEVWAWAGLTNFQGPFTVEPGKYGSVTGATSLATINDSDEEGVASDDFSIVIEAINKYF